MSEEGMIPEQAQEESSGTQSAIEDAAGKETAVEQALSFEEQLEQLRQELEAAECKAIENYEQWLRSVAEMRNYKKRIEQERANLIRDANAALISHLLPVIDDFERAMAVLPNKELLRFTWIEGVAMIFHRFQSILEQHGLQAIEAIEHPFDPYFHDAILYEEVDMDHDQIVLEELQKGYKLHDRVLRPTLVKVGRGVESSPEETTEDQPEQESPTPDEE
jgi:molecular chaperone GrpE